MGKRLLIRRTFGPVKQHYATILWMIGEDDIFPGETEGRAIQVWNKTNAPDAVRNRACTGRRVDLQDTKMNSR